jgi:5'-3' exonuclease
MKALIDGDEALFKACVIQHDDVDWDGGSFETRFPTYTEARDTLDSLIFNWTSEAGCDDFLVCLSPDDRKLFRRSIEPTYKTDRGEKPDYFWQLLSYMRVEYDCLSIPGLEADDVLGIKSGEGMVIVSSDKDMLTVPGRYWSPYKGQGGVISQARADYQWMLQTLTGDSSDGYKGCPGIGPKKATEALDEAPHWDTVERLFIQQFAKKKLGGSGDALAACAKQAALAHILRPGEYREDGLVEYRRGRSTVRIKASDAA